MRDRGRGVAPVLLGDSEVLEHHLRTQPARRQRHGGRAAGAEILGVRPGHAVHRNLGEVVERVDAVVVGIVGGGAVGHLDEEASRMLEHERQGVVGGDEMGVDGEAEEAEAVGEVVIPDRLVPFEQQLAAPDIIDQHVQPALLGPDALDRAPVTLGIGLVLVGGEEGGPTRDQLVEPGGWRG